MNKRLPILISLIVVASLAALSVQKPALAAPSFGEEQCKLIVSKALDRLQNACNKQDRNSACYGNDQINVEYNGADNLIFQQRGDRIPLKMIKSLVTFPLDVDTGTWGLSVLKVQANLPDTMPGQNVTFIVYGDTSVENASGDMQVFYFSSGLGQPTCLGMPPEGLIVQSPNHMQVSFTVNGVNVTIASTIYLRATPNASLDIALIEGHATVATGSGSRTLTPGQLVSVPLAGKSGLEANGAPSKPVQLDAATLNSFIGMVNLAKNLTPNSGALLVKNTATPSKIIPNPGLSNVSGPAQSSAPSPTNTKTQNQPAPAINQLAGHNGHGGSPASPGGKGGAHGGGDHGGSGGKGE